MNGRISAVKLFNFMRNWAPTEAPKHFQALKPPLITGAYLFSEYRGSAFQGLAEEGFLHVAVAPGGTSPPVGRERPSFRTPGPFGRGRR
jgi:hypothetical protein